MFVRFLGLLLLVVGCRTKIYQNTTARYNGYFLAKEKMIVVEKKIFDNRKDNYNRILHVYPVLDSNFTKGLKADLEDIIKKAAFALERHPKSNWTDNGYTVVGKARFYNREYEDAKKTFIYTQSNATEEQDRQKALMELMRLYIELDQMNEADQVKDLLRKLGLASENLLPYYLIQAHFYREKKDYERTAKSLDLALALMKRNEIKGRLLFLRAQLYQKEKNRQKAYKNFRSVLKNNPNYELRLQAKLGLLLNQDTTKLFSEKTQKTYQKFLEDLKNQEYRDKIYYDMSTVELHRGDIPKAVEYLKKSIAVSKDNPTQKSYAYLRLGEIHFDTLQKYEQAKSYYDSTISIYPKDEENYAKVAKRQEVLEDFVKQVNTIQTEDSLQRLAKMSESERETYLNKALQEKIQQEQILKAEQEKKLNEQRNNPGLQEGGNGLQEPPGSSLSEALQAQRGNNNWYFDNVELIRIGKQAFEKKYGRIALGDFWGIASKAEAVPVITNDTSNTESVSVENVDSSANDKASDLQKNQLVEARKQALMAQLPTTPEQIEKSNQKIEDALENLGKIYHFQLEQPKDAQKTYETFLNRFPGAREEPEILYLLYLLLKDQKKAETEKYKNLLLQKYPESIYAGLIRNPNYRQELEQEDAEAKKMYARAYYLYERRQYEPTIQLLNELVAKYPRNTIMDKVDFLKIISNKENNELDNFKAALEAFATKYQGSELSKKALEIVKDLTVPGSVQKKP